MKRNNGKRLEINWEMNWNCWGKNWKRWDYDGEGWEENVDCPDLYEVFSGDSCSLLEEEKAGETLDLPRSKAKKCMKKRPHIVR